MVALLGSWSVQWTNFSALSQYYPAEAWLHSFVVPTITVALLQCMVLLFGVRFSLLAFAWIPVSLCALIPYFGVVGVGLWLDGHPRDSHSIVPVALVFLTLGLYSIVLGLAQGRIVGALFRDSAFARRIWLVLNLLVFAIFLLGVYFPLRDFLGLPSLSEGAYPVLQAAVTGLGLAVTAARRANGADRRLQRRPPRTTPNVQPA
jgi:hypothetical protein